MYNKQKTHCKHGHLWNEDNSYFYMNIRQCRKCRNQRVRNQKSIKKAKDGQRIYYYANKTARYENWKRWAANNKEHYSISKIAKKYGMTVNDYKERIKSQDSCCFICNKKSKLVVDHNHITGEIRRLLCTNCNLGLGHFKDNPELLKNAANYCEGYNVGS